MTISMSKEQIDEEVRRFILRPSENLSGLGLKGPVNNDD